MRNEKREGEENEYESDEREGLPFCGGYLLDFMGEEKKETNVCETYTWRGRKRN